jgi:hypothetical protein
MSIRTLAPLALAALALTAAISAPVHATTINVTTDGSWYEFDVDDLTSLSGETEWIDNVTGPAGYVGDGSTMSFAFTLASGGVLRVVDAGFAGDTFQVFNGTTFLFETSAVPETDFSTAADIGTDFDAAFADHANFSYAEFLLGPGTYTIKGALWQSVLDGTTPLNATVGAISVSAVPVPAAGWLLVSALAGGFGVARRRKA